MDQMTTSQLKYMLVLGELSDNGGIRISDIARKLNIIRSSAFNMLNKLAEAGMVSKKEEDKKVILTEKGRTAADKLCEDVKQTAGKLEKYFSVDPGRSTDCALAVLAYKE